MADEEKKTEMGETPQEKSTETEAPAQEALAGAEKTEEAHPERKLKKPLDKMTAKELREAADKFVPIDKRMLIRMPEPATP